MDTQISPKSGSANNAWVQFANNAWVQMAALVIVTIVVIALAAKYIW